MPTTSDLYRLLDWCHREQEILAVGDHYARALLASDLDRCRAIRRYAAGHRRMLRALVDVGRMAARGEWKPCD